MCSLGVACVRNYLPCSEHREANIVRESRESLWLMAVITMKPYKNNSAIAPHLDPDEYHPTPLDMRGEKNII